MYEKTKLPSGRISVATPEGPHECVDDTDANYFIRKRRSARPKTALKVEPKAEPVVDLEPEPDPDAPSVPTR